MIRLFLCFIILSSLTATHGGEPITVNARKTPDSMLEKLYGFRWDLTRTEILANMARRPGVRQIDDWENVKVFIGGDFHGHPADTWGFEFTGDRLSGSDIKLWASGDMDYVYEQWVRKLTSLLGQGTIKRSKGLREAIWRTNSGGGSGKGEIVILRNRSDKDRRIWLFVHDPALRKPGNP